MIGKVIEGRYVGANICKLPDKNVLYIETDDGERIALSKKNIVSITDVTEQYPSYEKKVMMVMWNDHETSIYQIGYSAKPEVQMKEKTQPAKLQPVAKGVVRKKKRTSLIAVLVLVCVLVSLAITFYFLLKPSTTKDQNETAEVQSTEQSEAIKIVAPQNTEPPETVKSVTPEEFAYADDGFEESPEENSDRVQNGRPQYTWNAPITLDMPLADVQITMHKVENIEGAKPAYAIEIICDSMTSKELMTFMIHSTDDWGFDRISLVERIQKVLDMYDDSWMNDTMMYCSMSGYGIEWTASLGTDEHFCGIIGLTTNKANEFEAVLGMMPQDVSIITNDEITETTESPVIEESSKDQAYICRGMVCNTVTGVYIRVGPSTAYNSIGKVPPDTIVEILEFSDDGKWVRIESGWVYTDYISLVSDKTEQEDQPSEFYGEYKYTGKIIRASTVNLRQQPSTASPKVAELKNGAALVVYETTIAENMAWGRCDQGWVYLYYVDLTPVGTDAIDARVVYNYNTPIYADKEKNISVGTYQRNAIVDIYEINGKMARTDLGWIDTDNLFKIEQTSS